MIEMMRRRETVTGSDRLYNRRQLRKMGSNVIHIIPTAAARANTECEDKAATKSTMLVALIKTTVGIWPTSATDCATRMSFISRAARQSAKVAKKRFICDAGCMGMVTRKRLTSK